MGILKFRVLENRGRIAFSQASPKGVKVPLRFKCAGKNFLFSENLTFENPRVGRRMSPDCLERRMCVAIMSRPKKVGLLLYTTHSSSPLRSSANQQSTWSWSSQVAPSFFILEIPTFQLTTALNGGNSFSLWPSPSNWWGHLTIGFKGLMSQFNGRDEN